MIQPSPYWGNEPIWTSKNNVHNPMLDEKGRVWITSAVRPPDNPDVLQGGIGPSIGEAVSARAIGPAAGDVRPEEAASSRTSARASARTT